jgi:hypothetical protein
MNNFALASDSRSWWLPSALAGTVGVAVLGTILVLPTLGQAAPVTIAPAGSVGSDTGSGPACFMHRPARNHFVDEPPRPACR